MGKHLGRLASIGIALSVIAGTGNGFADAPGKWTATSTTSIAITGDITVTDAALIFGNGKSLPWQPAGTRNSVWTTWGDQTEGRIYRISPPSDPVALNGNTLCGRPVSYIVLSQKSPRSLGMTVFHSAGEPQRFGDQSCAVYFYEK